MIDDRFATLRARLVDFCLFPVRLRGLIGRLAVREIAARFKGSMLGIVWTLVGPVLSVSVYAIVFGMIFTSRVGTRFEGPSFVAWLFIGVSAFGFFSDVIGRAPILVASNAAYVKKVIFPLHVIPLVSLLGALPQYVLGMVIAALVLAPVEGWSVLVGLLVSLAILFPLVLLIVGLAWMLSAVSVYIRDLAQVTTYALSLLMFLSPVFYSLDAVPDLFRSLVGWSPLAFPIEAIRAGFFDGRLPHLSEWLRYAVAALVIYVSGFVCFTRLKRGFADFI